MSAEQVVDVDGDVLVMQHERLRSVGGARHDPLVKVYSAREVSQRLKPEGLFHPPHPLLLASKSIAKSKASSSKI